MGGSQKNNGMQMSGGVPARAMVQYMPVHSLDIDERRDSRIAQLVKEYIPKGPGLVFVRTKAHAKHLAALLQLPYVTSEISRSERRRIRDGLACGAIQAAVATAAWSTGVNIPALRWAIVPERVKAPIQILQGSGRVMRNAEGKPDFEIVNLVDATTESGRRYGAERERIFTSVGFEISADEMRLDELLTKTPEVKRAARPHCATHRGRQASFLQIAPQPTVQPGLRLGQYIIAIGLIILFLSVLDRLIMSRGTY